MHLAEEVQRSLQEGNLLPSSLDTEGKVSLVYIKCDPLWEKVHFRSISHFEKRAIKHEI